MVISALSALSCLLLSSPALAQEKKRGLLPTAPPVHVHTDDEGGDYWGVGYLDFTVKLPVLIYPEFTLGYEDTAYDLGDATYLANGLALARGSQGADRSREVALVAGKLGAELEDGRFQFGGVWFDSEHSREGGFVGARYAWAGRLVEGERVVLDLGLNSLLGVYWLRGNTRAESTSTDPDVYGYITMYQEKLRGLAWRPVATLQPAVDLTRWLTVIPFLGGSAFVAMDRSKVYVLEWEDARYGEDCSDGCPEIYRTVSGIPLEPFYGFDVEIQFTERDRFSLSSLFHATDPTNTERLSEVYALYSRTSIR